MTPGFQDAQQQHTATGWIAHAHPVLHHGGLPDLHAHPASTSRQHARHRRQTITDFL